MPRKSTPSWGPLAGHEIAVLGAGMVGVCTALELQARGARVTLIDRAAPGRETSYGNAGVLARSSLVPINNPGLFSDLPRMLGNRGASLRYDLGFVVRNASWAVQFLNHARPSHFRETTSALDALIRLSIDRHRQLLAECSLERHLSNRGWIFLYRSVQAYRKSARAREAMSAHGVDIVPLEADELRDLEPCLNGIFPRALWIRDSYSVNNPGAVVEGYARAFAERGGMIVQAEVLRFADGETGAELFIEQRGRLEFSHVVLCLGPWGRDFLGQSGYRATMAYERGYHRHFSGDMECGNQVLFRPIYDTGGGYVLAPMEQGLRLTSGVALCDRTAPLDTRQIEMAEWAARQALELGVAQDDVPWLGNRPTFPDSRPVIGPLPGTQHLSVAFGHQHIGFMTGPGTAILLADLLEGGASAIDPAAFRPDRFIRRR